MATTGIGRRFAFLSRFFSAESLTRKAYLNTINAVLEYGASTVVAFVVTPWLVTGLGVYYFGAWQILNRLVSYISPASNNPLQALKWLLANQQASADFDQKRRYVGSALVVCALFLPLISVAGGIIAWFVPYWLRAPVESFWVLRATGGLLVLNLVILTLAGLPHAILIGENRGYRRMGLRSLLILAGGGFTWLALRLGSGIAGLALAAVISTILAGLFLLLIARAYTPWFGISRPAPGATRHFLKLSWWFLAWEVVAILMLGSDVVVLGLLHSVESVTSYSLTKYAPDAFSSMIVFIVAGVTPGLGGMIGSRDLERATRVRSEIMSLTWLVLTVTGSSILLWNRSFLGLWVGAAKFAGSLPALLIVVVAAQLVLIQTDANIIDLTLRVERKVMMGALSVALALAGAGLFVGVFQLGIAGLCLGLLIGRSVLSVGYPMLVGRFLGIPFLTQLVGALRPAFVTVLFFAFAAVLDSFFTDHLLFGSGGWLTLTASAAATFIVALLLAFRTGLSTSQRRNVANRVRAVIPALTR